MKNLSKLQKSLICVLAMIIALGSTYYALKTMQTYSMIPLLNEKQSSSQKIEDEKISEFVSEAKTENSVSEFVIEIKENKFVPDVLEVPARKDFQLVVRNTDKTIEEFESVELKKEKLVKGGKEIVLNITALQPGEYKFFGEFHPKTAQGKIVAK